MGSTFTPPPISSLQPEAGFTPPPVSALQSEEHPKGFFSSLWEKANPVNVAKGLYQTVTNPVAALKSWRDQSQALHDKAVDAAQSGDYVGAAAHGINFLANVIPGLGTAMDEAAEAGQKALNAPNDKEREAAIDEAKSKFGALAGTTIALEEAKAGAEPVARAGAGIASRIGGGTASKLYQSALKPGVADAKRLADVRSQVGTGLENEIPVTEAGTNKLQALITDYGQKIKDAVQARAAAGATVDPNAVATRLNDVNTTQVLPEADVATVNKAKAAFLARKGAQPATVPQPTGVLDAQGNPVMTPGTPAQPAQPVPFDIAQAEKQGTYQQLPGKYGEAAQAQIEAEKALARGYKEEMEAQAPELKLLNAKEARFLDLRPALERAVRRAGNQDVVGLGTAAEVGGGMAAGGLPGAAAGFTARVLDFPMVKSQLAIAINKGSQRSGAPLTMAQSTARAAAVIAAMAGESTQK